METYNAACALIERQQTRIGDYYDAECKASRQRAQNSVRSLSEAFTAITKATREYVESGIAEVGRPWLPIEAHNIGWGRRGWRWNQYFRKLAKEMGRPYVEVNRQTHWVWHQNQGHVATPTIYLKFRKFKRHAPLASIILLAADPGGPVADMGTYSGLYWFRFKGEGLALYEQWLLAFKPKLHRGGRFSR